MKGKTIQNFQELVAAARKALTEGDEAEARVHAEALVSRFPKSEEGWLILASLSKPQEALAYLENALRANPDSQATRQGIRLVTSQILDEKKESPQNLELNELEDTQPISINILAEKLEDAKIDLTEKSNPDNLEKDRVPIQTEDIALSVFEEETTASDEVSLEEEPLQELPAVGEILEQIPEVLPDTENKTEIPSQINETVTQESLPEREKSISKNRVRLKRKPVQTDEYPKKDSKIKPVIKTRGERNSRGKNLNTDVIELLIIAGAAVLLPALVFLFFSLRK